MKKLSLQIHLPHRCALTKRVFPNSDKDLPRLCAACAAGRRPVCRYEDRAQARGCDLVEQHGVLFGWSESNCAYEALTVTLAARYGTTAKPGVAL